MKCLYLAGFSVLVYQSLGPMFDERLSEIMLSFASSRGSGGISDSFESKAVGFWANPL